MVKSGRSVPVAKPGTVKTPFGKLDARSFERDASDADKATLAKARAALAIAHGKSGEVVSVRSRSVAAKAGREATEKRAALEAKPEMVRLTVAKQLVRDSRKELPAWAGAFADLETAVSYLNSTKRLEALWSCKIRIIWAA